MTRITDNLILEKYPRPIAKIFYKFDSASKEDPDPQLKLLLKLAEETIRYLALVCVAKYIEIRESNKNTEADSIFCYLEHPSFGEWTRILNKFDKYFYKCNLPTPLGIRIDQTKVNAWFDFKGDKPFELTGDIFIENIVTLRNKQEHTGLKEALASRYVQSLKTSLFSLFDQIPVLEEYKLPVVVRKMEHSSRGHQAHDIELDPIVGTGDKGRRRIELDNPPDLIKMGIYLWDVNENTFLKISPLMVFDRESSALLMFAGVNNKGTPTYSAYHLGPSPIQPENIVGEFKERVGSLIQASRGSTPVDINPLESECGEETTFQIPPHIENQSKIQPDIKVKQYRNIDARLRARELDLADDIDGAIAAYRDILDKDPYDEDTRVSLVTLYDDIGKGNLAEQICREGLRVVGDTSLLRASLAKVLLEKANREEVYHEAIRAYELDPTCPDAVIALARCYAMDGLDDERRRILDKALVFYPDHSGLLSEYAEIDDGVLTLNERREFAEKAIRNDPRDRDIRSSYLETLYPEAEKGIEKECEILLARNQRNYIYKALLAIIYAANNRIDDASKLLDECLQNNSSGRFALIAQASVNSIKGDYNSALTAVNELEHRWPNSYIACLFKINYLKFKGDNFGVLRELKRVMNIHSNSIGLQLRLAGALEDVEQYQEALQLASSIFERRPKWEEARLRIISILNKLSRYEEAEKWLDGAQDSSKARMYRGLLFLNTERPAEAEAIFRELISYEDISFEDWLGLVYALGHQGKGTEAKRLVEQIGYVPPNLKLAVSNALSQSEKFSEAVSILEELKEEKGLDWDTAFQVACASGRPDLALHFARKGVEENPATDFAHFNLASILQDNEEYEESINEYKECLNINNKHSSALNNLALIYQDRMEYERALDLFMRAKEIDGEDKSSTLLLNMAFIQFHFGKVDEAIANGNEAIRIDVSENCFVNWALMLKNNGQTDKALEVIKQFINIQPMSTEIRRTLASIQSDSGDQNGALETLREAERWRPRYAPTHFSFGQIYEKMGKPQSALISFRQAHELDPENMEIACSYSKHLIRLGQFDKAKTVMNTALDKFEEEDIWCSNWLNCYYEEKRYEKGLELTREFQNKYQSKSYLVGFEGLFLDALGQHDEALPYLQDSAKTDTRFCYRLGYCLKSLQRWEEAVEAFQRANQENDDPDNYRNLFDCYVEMRKYDWAKDALEELLLREPEAPDACEKTASLEKLAKERGN